MAYQIRAGLAFAFLILLAFTACSENGPQEQASSKVIEETPADSEELAKFFDEKFEASLVRNPEFAFFLGREGVGHIWNDYSQEFKEQSYQIAEKDLQELRDQFDVDKLSPSDRLSYRIFETQKLRYLDGHKFRYHTYSINQMYGAHTNFPQTLINQHRIDTIDDANDYIARLHGIPKAMADIRQGLTVREELGVIPPKFAFPIVLESIDRLLTGFPFKPEAEEETALLSDFKSKLAKLDIDPEEADRLISEAKEALLESFLPAYTALRDQIATLEGQATEDDGVWKLPNGEAYYNHRLAIMTTTDLSAEEIHQYGLAEVERIHEEMRQLIKQMGFEGTLEAYFDLTQNDERFYYPNTDEGRQAYLEEAKKAVARVMAKQDEFSTLKLEDLVEVKPVEKYRENGAALASYSSPAPDGSRPGTYYVNTSDMARLPTYQLEVLVFHEAIPGHHYQGSLTQKLEDLPMFRRYTYFTAHGEGWGLYSERLASEMGLYSSLEGEFGRLTLELWRALRLVVDTGIHYKKWTRQQAIDCMVDNSPMDIGTITNEVERYIVSPGQATAYKIGMKKILDLRAEARNQMGDQFDIREYHNVVLKNGAVPLDILEEDVALWIAQVKSESEE
jgi:uncharacterized protein (DUF885 family)